LSGFVGESFKDMKAVLIAKAPLNIHHIDAILLDALFSHYDAPLSVAQRIISTRDNKELTEAWLTEALTDIEYNPLLNEYIGVKSWFWRISVKDAEYELDWILCRTSADEDETDGLRINLIEESIRPAE
jgi:hypothetical protein